MSSSLKQAILSFDAPVPRYTSYPPAPFFREDFVADEYLQWLREAEGTLSLYFHIPFCARLCHYCGCYTKVTNTYDRVAAYIGDLRKEIALISPRAIGRVTHIHFGGGSPTMIAPPDFRALTEFLRDAFDIAPAAEIAVEADPRQMSEARVAAFAASGVNRISLGVQDFDETVMRAVNRPQGLSHSWHAVRLCRAYGIDRINFDLMYGLPGQSVKSIERGMELALGLGPSRVAFFGYAHVPWMKRHMDLMQELPDAAQRFDMFEAGREKLVHAGYLPVGIDHFARPGDSMVQALHERRLRRNFQGYTTDAAQSLVGVGASAIGRLSDGYVQNIADLRLYGEAVGAGMLPVNKGYRLTDADRLHGAIIEDIMCHGAVDLHAHAQVGHLTDEYFRPFLDALEPLEKAGLVRSGSGRIEALHPLAIRLAARAFDCTAAPGRRHAKAV